MEKLKATEELIRLFRNRTQIIQIRTSDTKKPIDDIKKMIIDGKTIFKPDTKINQWSAGSFREIPKTKNAEQGTGIALSVSQVLGIVRQSRMGKGGFTELKPKNMVWEDSNQQIFIIKDLQLFMSDKMLIASLRDIYDEIDAFTEVYCPIVILGCNTNIADELGHVVKVIDYDTPDKEEIATLAKKKVTAYNKAIEVANKKTLDAAKKKAEKNGVEFDESKIKLKEKAEVPSDETIAKISELAIGSTYVILNENLEYSLKNFGKIDVDYFTEYRIKSLNLDSMLKYSRPHRNLDDMCGNTAIKQWINENKLTFTDEAKEFGVDPAKGCLLVGAPGTGKSEFAYHMASALDNVLLELDMSKIMNHLVGQTEQNTAKVIELVDKVKPCVLLIDEIEKTFSGSGSSNKTDGGTLMRIIGKFLQYFASKESEGVFLVFTSNDAQELPPELTRAGRIDTVWLFGLPKKKTRKEIFEHYFAEKNKTIDEDLLLTAIEYSNNFTGAEIKQAVKNTIRIAYCRSIKDGNKDITRQDIIAGVKEVVPVYSYDRDKIDAVLKHYEKTAKPTDLAEEEEIFEVDEFEEEEDKINLD